MKRTKKFLLGLLACLGVLAGSLGFVACGETSSSVDDSSVEDSSVEDSSVENSLIDEGATEGVRYQQVAGKEEYTVIGLETGADGDIVISSTYDGLPVTSIGANAFSDNPNLTSVTIPNGIISLAYRSFYGCKNLASVTIPDSVTSIAGSVFDHCTSLTSITIPDSVTSISTSTFFCCTSLTSVTLSSNLKAISNNLFNACSSLTSITIPETVTSIGDNAFGYCSALTSVTIPEKVTKIGYRAFYYCTGLTSVNIPAKVTTIGEKAFGGCDSLQYKEDGGAKYLGNADNEYFALVEVKNADITNLTVHNDTKVIANKVFSGYGSLASVTFSANLSHIGANAFEYCTSLSSITFNGTKAQWNKVKKNSGWNTNIPATKVVCSDEDVNL